MLDIKKLIVKDNYKIYKNNFNSVQDVIKYIRKTPINTKIFNKFDLASEKLGNDRFNDFSCFSEACEALEYGTNRYLSSFMNEFKKAQKYIKKYFVKKSIGYKNDIVGFTPIVPNFIKGYPISMINQEKKDKPIPTATIIFEKAISHMHNSNDIVSFASIIFSIIQILENKGIRCQVYISAVYANEDEIYVHKIKLKNFTQPLNTYKLQFPVVSSDMFRRIGFRLLECCSYLTNESWNYGYGHTLINRDGYCLNNGEPNGKLQRLLDMKQDDIFIPNYPYFNYNTSDDIDTTIKNIINGTNLKKYFRLEEFNNG